MLIYVTAMIIFFDCLVLSVSVQFYLSMDLSYLGRRPMRSYSECFFKSVLGNDYIKSSCSMK